MSYTSQSPSQTIGPMYGFALFADGMDQTTDAGDPAAVAIEGLLLDGDGEPIAYPDGLVEVWQGEQLARARTDPFGRWKVRVRKPDRVPDLPDRQVQAPHFNVTVWARGLNKQAQTRLYFPDEAEANAKDPVLQLVEPERRAILVAQEMQPGRLRFDISIQGENEMVFFEF